MKKISIKNYIICFLIFIVTTVITLYMVVLCDQNKQYYMNNSVLTDIFHEIVPEKNLTAYDNLNNFLIENGDLLLYMSAGTNLSIKDFELEFKEQIAKKHLKNSIMYINIDNIKKTDFLNQLKDSYINISFDDSNYSKQIFIFAYKDGKIVKVYNSFKPNVYEALAFLIENEVINND